MQANKGCGVCGSKKCYDAEKAALWRSWIKEGLTRPEIAERAGVHLSTVYKAFQDY